MKAWKRWMAALAAVACLAGCRGAAAEAVRRETEKYGKVTEVVWEDENGQLTAGPDGYARVTYSYDGSDTTERYYTASGTPFRMTGGYCGLTITRDSKRRITGIVYLDEAWKRAENTLGYARVRMDYTSFGEVKFLSFYGRIRRDDSADQQEKSGAWGLL